MDIKTLEELTVEQLEAQILSHYATIKRSCCASRDKKLKQLLFERQRKINEAFEWTPENIEKLLDLNQRFMRCFENLRNEAAPIVATLERRIDDKDTFLHDFEIEGRVKPFILTPDEEEPDEGIDRILSEMLYERRTYTLTVDMKHKDSIKKCMYLAPVVSWNARWPKGKFDEYHLSYAIHELIDTYWSVYDILRINHLWSEVKIAHQNFSEKF